MCADRLPDPNVGLTSHQSSRELLARVHAGDSSAANRLFARVLPQLHRWAHGRMPQWARGIVETADVVQDAMLHTFRRLRDFEPERDGALLGYLRRALLNRIRDQFRNVSRRPRSVPLDERERDHGRSPLDLALHQERHERYLLALKSLRPDDRNIIIARLELGYTYDQLALVTNKPTAEAARLAVRRALYRLAREMEQR